MASGLAAAAAPSALSSEQVATLNILGKVTTSGGALQRIQQTPRVQDEIVPTLAENSGLSVKRVRGFLAGWTVPNLAAPYDGGNPYVGVNTNKYYSKALDHS